MNDKLSADLSEVEIHRLLLEKRQEARQDRLDSFRRTGRITREPGERHVRTNLDGRPDESGHRLSDPHLAWTDRVLAGAEFLSVVILLGLLLNGTSILQRLNFEVAAAFRQPALEPMPLISAVVLPEGHTPPNAPGGAQPNVAEIPEHLRPLVQVLVNVPIPTPESQQAVRIIIPAIEVDAPVVQGDGWEQLKLGVAQHAGTPDPGENGNIVLSGHNDVYGEVFRFLDRLMPGDIVNLYTLQRQYTYIVTGTQIVEPTQVEVMLPTQKPTLTLISCYPYLVDDHRIVVTAVLQYP